MMNPAILGHPADGKHHTLSVRVQRDGLKIDVKELSSQLEEKEEAIGGLKTEKLKLEGKIVGLTNDLQSRTNEMNREIRRKERTEIVDCRVSKLYWRPSLSFLCSIRASSNLLTLSCTEELSSIRSEIWAVLRPPTNRGQWRGGSDSNRAARSAGWRAPISASRVSTSPSSRSVVIRSSTRPRCSGSREGGSRTI